MHDQMYSYPLSLSLPTNKYFLLLSGQAMKTDLPLIHYWKDGHLGKDKALNLAPCVYVRVHTYRHTNYIHSSGGAELPCSVPSSAQSQTAGVFFH